MKEEKKKERKAMLLKLIFGGTFAVDLSKISKSALVGPFVAFSKVQKLDKKSSSKII